MTLDMDAIYERNQKMAVVTGGYAFIAGEAYAIADAMLKTRP